MNFAAMNMAALLALAAALSWTMAALVSHRPASELGSLHFNRLRMVAAVVIMGVLLLLSGRPVTIATEFWPHIILSSLAGIVCGDFLLFATMRRLGPRLNLSDTTACAEACLKAGAACRACVVDVVNRLFGAKRGKRLAGFDGECVSAGGRVVAVACIVLRATDVGGESGDTLRERVDPRICDRVDGRGRSRSFSHAFEPSQNRRSVPGKIPVAAAADFDIQRYGECRRVSHSLPDDLFSPVPLPRRDLDHEFVVDLQQHPRT